MHFEPINNINTYIIVIGINLKYLEFLLYKYFKYVNENPINSTIIIIDINNLINV